MTVALRRGLRASLLACAFALIVLCSSASAYTFGSLDASFAGGPGFKAYEPLGVNGGQTNAVALQSDGKIVFAGASGSPQRAWVTRLLPDGTPDPTFGSGGTSEFSAAGPGANPLPLAVAIQPDGKIVVAGQAQTGHSVALIYRLNADGTLDTNADADPASSFGVGGGGYTIDALDTGNFTDVKVLGDGSVLAAGGKTVSGSDYLLIARFSSDGLTDSSFYTNATTATAALKINHGDPDEVRAFSNAAGDRYTFATTNYNGNYEAIRLKSDGSIDTAYGPLNTGVGAVSSAVQMSDAIMDSSGRVVFAGGVSTVNPQYKVAVGRITSTGSVDNSFGSSGTGIFNVTPADRNTAMAIAELADGRLLTLNLSFTNVGDKPYPTTSLFTAGGQPDTSFGNAGVFSYPELGAVAYPTSMTLQQNGRAIFGGVSADATFTQQLPFLARIHGFNDPDPIVPASKISSPSKSKYAAKKLTKFSGKATPAGQIAKVEIALQKIDAQLLKKKKRCLWLSRSKAKFKKVKAVAKKCSAPRWLKASGTASWSYKLKKKLPAGSYRLSVRATATDGNVQAVPTTKRFKVTR